MINPNWKVFHGASVVICIYAWGAAILDSRKASGYLRLGVK